MPKYAPSFDDDVVSEVQGSLSEIFSEDGITCAVQLLCPYDLRHDVVADIVGAREFWPHGSFTKRPFAVSAGIVPFDAKTSGNGQLLVYEKALVTVNYERKKKDPDQIASESFEGTCEFQTLDHKPFLWTDADGDPLSEAEAPGFQVRGLNIVRTIYNMSSVPAAVLSCMGGVNDEPYVSSLLGMTFPEETMLYHPPSGDKTTDTSGSDGTNLTIRFGIHPVSWNKFWRSKTNAWERIFDSRTGAEHKNYPLVDMSSLLGS